MLLGRRDGSALSTRKRPALLVVALSVSWGADINAAEPALKSYVLGESIKAKTIAVRREAKAPCAPAPMLKVTAEERLHQMPARSRVLVRQSLIAKTEPITPGSIARWSIILNRDMKDGTSPLRAQ